MKLPLLQTVCAIVLFSFSVIERGAGAASADTNGGSVSVVFERFAKEKYALEETLAKKHGVEIPSQLRDFFVAAQKEDWTTSSNLFYAMEAGTGRRVVTNKWFPLVLWGPVHDTYGAYELVHAMSPKFVRRFGADIVKDIPAGSIYFGGTDPGRFLVSAFSQSHSEGRPFFTLTQNALADPTYLIYAADMYGDKIKVADTNDSQKSFSDYMADAQVRIRHDQEHPNEPRQLKPGEDAHLNDSGHVEVSGQVAIMAINALMTQAIFEKNPSREFYVEESFPLDWMFPQLTPFGAIMKLNRAEIPELTEDVLKRDHEFWTGYAGSMIGDWITYDTTVKEVTDFAEKVYLRDDDSGFHGDLDFIHDQEAQKCFSKLRSSIAGIYSWRLGQPPSGGIMPPQYIAKGAGRKLIEKEDDFAFKQSVALCPYSPEAVFRYVQFLVNTRRVDDALLIAETGLKIDPANTQFTYLIQNLKTIKDQAAGSSAKVQNEIAALEKAVEANPTNVMQQFDLARKYVQVGQNDRAYTILDRIAALPDATVPEVMSVADAYNRLNQPQRLSVVLEKLTQLAPDSPEAWYDLAAARATLRRTAPALEALKKSLDLNDKRLAQDPKAKDVRSTLSSDPRFSNLRGTEDFKAMVGK